MQCKIFIGPWNQVMDAFNQWAKGKALSKDVIIHTQTYTVYKAAEYSEHMTITVYHPEEAPWIGAADKWKERAQGENKQG